MWCWYGFNFLFNQQILVKFLKGNQSQQKQESALQKSTESTSERLRISFRNFCFGKIEREIWLVRKNNFYQTEDCIPEQLVCMTHCWLPMHSLQNSEKTMFFITGKHGKTWYFNKKREKVKFKNSFLPGGWCKFD